MPQSIRYIKKVIDTTCIIEYVGGVLLVAPFAFPREAEPHAGTFKPHVQRDRQSSPPLVPSTLQLNSPVSSTVIRPSRAGTTERSETSPEGTAVGGALWSSGGSEDAPSAEAGAPVAGPDGSQRGFAFWRGEGGWYIKGTTILLWHLLRSVTSRAVSVRVFGWDPTRR